MIENKVLARCPEYIAEVGWVRSRKEMEEKSRALIFKSGYPKNVIRAVPARDILELDVWAVCRALGQL